MTTFALVMFWLKFSALVVNGMRKTIHAENQRQLSRNVTLWLIAYAILRLKS